MTSHSISQHKINHESNDQQTQKAHNLQTLANTTGKLCRKQSKKEIIATTRSMTENVEESTGREWSQRIVPLDNITPLRPISCISGELLSLKHGRR